jgi:hypothetical protein
MKLDKEIAPGQKRSSKTRSQNRRPVPNVPGSGRQAETTANRQKATLSELFSAAAAAHWLNAAACRVVLRCGAPPPWRPRDNAPDFGSRRHDAR